MLVKPAARWEFAQLWFSSGKTDVFLWRSPYGTEKTYGAQTTHLAFLLPSTTGTWRLTFAEDDTFILTQNYEGGRKTDCFGKVIHEFDRSFARINCK
jgi:hypothetical protein